MVEMGPGLRRESGEEDAPPNDLMGKPKRKRLREDFINGV
jgi:hypothetical protein